jgi:fructoselysine 6-kinase
MSSSAGPSRLSPALACVGDNCIDHYLTPVDKRFAAGNAVNVAVGLRHAGFAVDYFGAVGNDPDGRLILAGLRAETVGVEHVEMLAAGTSLTEVRITGAGERVFTGWVEGASELYDPSRADVAALAGRPAVHVVNLRHRDALLAELVVGDAMVTCDFDQEPDLGAVDGLAVAFFSALDDDSPNEAAELAVAATQQGAACAVVMRGRHGCVACDGGRSISLLAEDIQPVDTCGAGDSYIAAFVAARLRGDDLAACMHAATSAAGATCLHLGAWPSHSAAAAGSHLPVSPIRRPHEGA